MKAGKELKNLPPAAKKDKKIAELLEQSKELRKQASRMRQTLEQAMCRGDEFTGGELASLMEHPVLRPMLARLVLVGESSGGTALIGYPDKGGKALRDHQGELEPLKGTDRVRVAHPHDFLKARTWDKWQRECFAAERVQPFKQLFRELYVLSATEKGAVESSRFAGHQVQPRQGLALLGSRQWVVRPEEGVQKTFHAERITASLSFEEYFFTPADVEGLTIGKVGFTASGKREEIDLAKVPPRLFSEVMRDVDLVVSVAHRGGVDPEASESTVQMRASLMRETCKLLGLTNVTVADSRATIKGVLREYSLHLGSGMIHMLPGGAVWVAPIHSQHRGRVFLPFVDDDPKTAEVISKAIMLARDAEIKDPGIIEQIRRR